MITEPTPATGAFREPHVTTTGAYTEGHAAQPALLRRVSWGAIFAGFVVALAVQLLLTLLGLGIGIGTIDPATEANTLSGIGTGAGIWAGVSVILALLAGGFVAARLAGMPMRPAAVLHGISVWALVVLATAYLATTAAGSLISGATGVVTNAAQVASSAVGGVASGAANLAQAAVPDDVNFQNVLSRVTGNQTDIGQSIRAEARELSRQTGVGRDDLRQAGDALSTAATDIIRTPSDAGADISQLIDNLVGGEGAALSPEERQQIVQTIAQRTGVTPEQAEQRLQGWETRLQNAAAQVEQTLEEARTEAAQFAESAFNALGQAALWAFFGLLIALGAAVLGARFGAPKLLTEAEVADASR